ncbi:hypothetical protein D3C73_1326800 [compost metagenome]
MVLSVLTIIAPVVLCSIYLFKGFSLGIYISILYSIFGAGYGTLVVFLTVILPNLIYIPIFLYIGVNEINFYYNLMDRSVGKIKGFFSQGYMLIISFSFILVSIIIEQSVVSIVFNIYSKLHS